MRLQQLSASLGSEYDADITERQTVCANANGARIGGTMQPQLNLKGLFAFVTGALSAISITVSIVLLFVSRARWATFKQMFFAWVVVFLSGIAVALVAGPLFNSHLLVEILSSMSFGVASVVATVLGIRHVRTASQISWPLRNCKRDAL